MKDLNKMNMEAIYQFCSEKYVGVIINNGEITGYESNYRRSKKGIGYEDLTEDEQTTIEAGVFEMSRCKDADSINKIYRQLRIWNRWHSLPDYNSRGRSNEVHKYLNELIKNMRYSFLHNLGY